MHSHVQTATNAVQTSLVSAEGELLLLDSVAVNDVNYNRISSVDVSLSSRDKAIFDDAYGPLPGWWHWLHILHVLETNLVVQQRLKQGTGRASRPVLHPFTVANRVVAIDAPFSVFVKASQNVGDVVGEEPLVVQQRDHELGHCRRAHMLLVLMQIHLHSGFKKPCECKNIAPATRGTEDTLVGQLEQLRLLPRVDLKSTAQTTVRRDDGEIFSSNSHNAPSVVSVGIEVRLLRPSIVRKYRLLRQGVHAKRLNAARTYNKAKLQAQPRPVQRSLRWNTVS